jgi:NADP-dependent 3-hydroxy acid dehydrogenase YdfG/acyl carrier protein
MNNLIKVKIITKNTQKIGENEAINVSQAPIWGLAKVIAHEYSEIFDGIIDIDEFCLNGEFTLLMNEMISNEVEEVCLRQDKNRYINRLIQHKEYMSNPQHPLDSITISSEGEYLITGATGAVGMSYAQYIVNSGARKILFMCRNYPNDSVMAQMNSFKEKGVKIELLLADVCNASEVEKVLANYKNIVGVIHGAGVLKDKMLRDLDWDEFEYVMNPKVKGTLNVLRAINLKNIDFFIMLSSITSVLGNIGQANYASANYFMNSLAHYMEQKGVHGYAVCWGPWQSGGMVNENNSVMKNLSASGIKSFDKDTALKLIGELFDNINSNITVLDIDWKKYEENTNSKNTKKLISKLVLDRGSIEKQEKDINNDSILEQLISAEEETRVDLLSNYLQQVCAKIMGFTLNENLDVNVSFKEQGADSLMIFSIRSIINKALNVEMNISALYNYPTISKLTEYLIDEVLFVKEMDQGVTDVTSDSTENLLNELNDLIL